MILAIKNWCEGIIIAVIISIIIELLIPDGNNKKYVKVVSGIYIMFIVLNPILQLLRYDISFENIFKFEDIEVSATLNENMKQVYVVGMEETIKKELENLGYTVEKIKVFVDLNYENIEKIELKVHKVENKVKIIEQVEIGKNSQKSSFEYTDIVNFLKENYSVDIENIIFLDT